MDQPGELWVFWKRRQRLDYPFKEGKEQKEAQGDDKQHN